MILTVTPNTALDRVLFVDDFALGRTVRATEAADGMGGKGAVTSWVLGQLGTPSVATGLAGGETGRRMAAVLEAAAVRTAFLWVAGETRTNYVVARAADGVQGTITVAGLAPTPDDGDRLRDHVIGLLEGATFLLCGGSLPPGLPDDWYTPLIGEARRRGIPTLLDASGPHLEANVGARPDIIKPNAHEAEALLGAPVAGVDEAAAAAETLRARGIGMVVITLGPLGAVAATDEGTYQVPPIEVRVRNTAGAGDGFNAGLIRARLAGAGWQEALAEAVTVATAILLTPGTGALHPEDVVALRSRAVVKKG